MEAKDQIPIWFFIGVILTIYGVLITASGFWALGHPPARQVELSYLHADIWWGLILLGLGVVYCVKFRPART